MLACDFETTVYEGQTYTEVWSAAYARLFYDKVSVTHSIDEFIKELADYRVNIVCWFHNERFDGTFIVNYLLTHGWEWTDNKKLDTGQFKTLISKQNRWYSITLKTGNATIEIRDSVKLMPMTLEEMGVAFNTAHRKKQMEYVGKRYAGCNITPVEMDYIINDVLVLKEALEYMFDEGHTNLTIGSCALKTFKQNYSKREMSVLFPDMTKYEVPYECLKANNADEFIRRSYKGGYCHLRIDRVGRAGKGRTYDVNSLYPSMMHSKSGNKYPIGEPKFWEGDIPDAALQKSRIYFVMIRCAFKLKDGKLPTIQIKGNPLYPGNEWLSTSDVKRKGKYYSTIINDNGEEENIKVDLTLTCVDYELFKEHYDIFDLEVIGGCWFYAREGLFDEYIDYWMYKKMNAKSKAERTEAKLFLNNLYGKFATSTDSSYQEPVLAYDNSIDFVLHEENNKTPGYIPVGTMVTSYSRDFTIRHAQANYDNFIYADTDSLHLKDGIVVGLKIHETELLCWKLESEWSSAVFLRQKTYCEFIRKEDGNKVYPYWHIKCAGMPERCKRKFLATHPITDFNYGLSVSGKLVPKRIPGGIVLKDTNFTLRKR